jgi:hypothetical protein
MPARGKADPPGQSHLKKPALGFGEKLHARHAKGRKRHPRRLEMWQGLKPGFFLWSFCGLTEVMPVYKARFDGVVEAA